MVTKPKDRCEGCGQPAGDGALHLTVEGRRVVWCKECVAKGLEVTKPR